jgi:plastocyanin
MFPTYTPTAEEILSGDVHVEIKEFHFGPEIITVQAGSTVHWSNSDNDRHIVVADNGSFHSERIYKGDEFAFTFNRPGTFTYHCNIHALMKGTIIVVP